ncbi:MAG: sodium/proton antiporter [Elusimicrobia bacterium ADurb.Bin231]|nr:MAG: sodium/proton antiporter [Elusimicrobia bacterium ADurb.Bin231]
MTKKFCLLILLSLLIGVVVYNLGIDAKNAFIFSIFFMSILGTLFFWEFRLSFVFIGSGALLLIKAVSLEKFLQYASLDVVLFLIGMMIVVAMMKEAGFFLWLVTSILKIRHLTGKKLFVLLLIISAVLSGIMDEVSSIIVMMTVILEISAFLEVSPVPLVISSIMTTNIGSATTMLGNPIGILIASRAGFSFEDFLFHSLPVSIITLIATIFILTIWYNNYIKELSAKFSEKVEKNSEFVYLISVPPDRKTKISMLIFGSMILSIAFHKRLEMLLGIEPNTLVVILPVIFAGVVLIYHNKKAAYYIEHEVEWNSLLFFLFLFAQAGVIKASGLADFFAAKIFGLIGHNYNMLVGAVIFSSGLLSSILDNVIVVASYIPVIHGLNMLNFKLKSLWWATLFGACYGGNITLVGSTANIVALCLLEKQRKIKIDFFQWFKIGTIVGFSTLVISYLIIILFPIVFMK